MRMNKKAIVGLFATLLALASLMIHTAYAAKQKISLNSAISFPVDI